MDKNDMGFMGKRLKALRLEKKYTVAQMAKLLDVSERAYMSYEKCERNPSTQSLAKLAVIFGVSADYLIGVSDVPEISRPKHVVNDVYKIRGIDTSGINPNAVYTIKGVHVSDDMPNVVKLSGKPSFVPLGEIKTTVNGVKKLDAASSARVVSVTKEVPHIVGVIDPQIIEKTKKEKRITQAVKKMSDMSDGDLDDMFTIMEYLEYRKKSSEK
jgi:transcriptional regulator with XRE-family HTH domain